MNIFLRDIMINLDHVSAVRVEDEKTTFSLSNGKDLILTGPEFPWFILTPGVMPGIRLDAAYADRERIAASAAKVRAQQGAATSPDHVYTQPTVAVEKTLQDAEADLAQLDNALDLAESKKLLTPEILLTARARRAELQELINRRSAPKEKVN
jgi:hypothetical protein